MIRRLIEIKNRTAAEQDPAKLQTEQEYYRITKQREREHITNGESQTMNQNDESQNTKTQTRLYGYSGGAFLIFMQLFGKHRIEFLHKFPV